MQVIGGPGRRWPSARRHPLRPAAARRHCRPPTSWSSPTGTSSRSPARRSAPRATATPACWPATTARMGIRLRPLGRPAPDRGRLADWPTPSSTSAGPRPSASMPSSSTSRPTCGTPGPGRPTSATSRRRGSSAPASRSRRTSIASRRAAAGTWPRPSSRGSGTPANSRARASFGSTAGSSSARSMPTTAACRYWTEFKATMKAAGLDPFLVCVMLGGAYRAEFDGVCDAWSDWGRKDPWSAASSDYATRYAGAKRRADHGGHQPRRRPLQAGREHRLRAEGQPDAQDQLGGGHHHRRRLGAARDLERHRRARRVLSEHGPAVRHVRPDRLLHRLVQDRSSRRGSPGTRSTTSTASPGCRPRRNSASAPGPTRWRRWRS